MNKKIKVVVIGGTGLIGKKVVMNLGQRGHEVVAASPSSGVNTVTGEGLAQALAGAQVVVDVSNAPNWVAVGTALSGRPPHRSGRAGLPHPALILPILGIFLTMAVEGRSTGVRSSGHGAGHGRIHDDDA